MEVAYRNPVQYVPLFGNSTIGSSMTQPINLPYVVLYPGSSIQAAITALNGVGHIYLTKGTYTIASATGAIAIPLNPQLVIEGENFLNTVIKFTVNPTVNYTACMSDANTSYTFQYGFGNSTLTQQGTFVELRNFTVNTVGTKWSGIDLNYIDRCDMQDLMLVADSSLEAAGAGVGLTLRPSTNNSHYRKNVSCANYGIGFKVLGDNTTGINCQVQNSQIGFDYSPGTQIVEINPLTWNVTNYAYRFRGGVTPDAVLINPHNANGSSGINMFYFDSVNDWTSVSIYNFRMTDTYPATWTLVGGSPSATAPIMYGARAINGVTLNASVTVPATTVAWTNVYGYPVNIYTSGGTVQGINYSPDGTNQYAMATSGMIYDVEPSETVTWTYTVVPTVTAIARMGA